MKFEITVLMSVYNGEKYLREAIESILNQTYKKFEFLIINDGSTDSSRDIILSYDDSRIRLVDNEQNIGLTRCLNKGLKLAKGKYIARMDADDISMPERLEKQINFMDKRSEIGLVTSWYEVIDSKNELISTTKTNRSFENFYYFLTFGNQFPHSSTFFKKQMVLDIGGYDEKYEKSQDYDLWFRLSRVARIEMISEILIKWRNDKFNISNLYKYEQDNFARQIFINNLEKMFHTKLNFNEYIYLFNNFDGKIEKKNLIRSIIHLIEINIKIANSINPALKIDRLKLNKEIENNMYYKTIEVARNIINIGSYFDILSFIISYPNKVSLFRYFLKNKGF